MLNLYLIPKQHPHYHPTLEQIQSWMTLVQTSQVIKPLQATPLSRLDDLSQYQWISHLGISALFDQDAHKALLPAELTFERLTLKSSPFPCFLPLSDQLELDLRCRQCGDDLDLDAFYQAVQTLHFQSLDEFKVDCFSCDDVLNHKGIECDQSMGFARFWIEIEQCGTTRLNPALIKEWGQCLKTPLMIIPERLDDQELIWGDHEELSTQLESPSWFESNKPSRLRAHGRQGRLNKRRSRQEHGQGRLKYTSKKRTR